MSEFIFLLYFISHTLFPVFWMQLKLKCLAIRIWISYTSQISILTSRGTTQIQFSRSRCSSHKAIKRGFEEWFVCMLARGGKGGEQDSIFYLRPMCLSSKQLGLATSTFQKGFLILSCYTKQNMALKPCPNRVKRNYYKLWHSKIC